MTPSLVSAIFCSKRLLLIHNHLRMNIVLSRGWGLRGHSGGLRAEEPAHWPHRCSFYHWTSKHKVSGVIARFISDIRTRFETEISILSRNIRIGLALLTFAGWAVEFYLFLFINPELKASTKILRLWDLFCAEIRILSRNIPIGLALLTFVGWAVAIL